MNFSDLLKACAYKLLPYVICIFVGLIVGGFVVYDHMAPNLPYSTYGIYLKIIHMIL